MTSPLVDGFGRTISYVRLSVTDRCDLRCTYCMSEYPAFLPRRELLTWDEMESLCRFLVGRGVEHIRITGGEPLVRKGVLDFLKAIGRIDGLKALTLTTNGTQLEAAVPALVEAGIRRINVSCDSLNPDTFRRITRGGDLTKVLAGVETAQGSGIAVKLNVVALEKDNRAELPDLISFAHACDMDMSLIETMPMGNDIEDRQDQFVSLADVLADLRRIWRIEALPETTPGPARYYRVAETGGRLGLITPMSHNFCDTCNRVRITCTGRMYMCLGQDDHVDLRGPLRGEGSLDEALGRALAAKPKRHEFHIPDVTPDAEPGHNPARGMFVTGG